MKEDNDENLDIEIIMGDDSELEISEVEDSITSLRPKDKVPAKKVIIPKSQSEKNNEKNNEKK